MSTFFKNLQSRSLTQIVLTFVIGLALLIWPHTILQFVTYVLAAYLLFLSVQNLVPAWQRRRNTVGRDPQMTLGWVLLILALLVLVFTPALLSMIPIVLGLLILITGIGAFMNARRPREFVNKSHAPQYVYSILIMVLGLLLLLNPFHSVLLGLRLCGVAMIIIAGRDVWDRYLQR